MTPTDLIGYGASTLVLAAFCMRGMVALRLAAIASNLAFIAYGVLAGIDPVLLLHMVLLPLNAVRLAQTLHTPQILTAAAVRPARPPSTDRSTPT